MKAVILAAGKGKRMGDLTKEIPKPLIKIEDRPFLYFLIENIKKAGIDEICIIVGHKKEKIEEFVNENNLSITLIEQNNPKGTADAVGRAESFTKDDDFIVLNGDTIYSTEDIKSFNVEDSFSYVGALHNDYPERCGVIKEEGDFLVEIIEKPQEFISNYVNAGLYKFTKEVYTEIKKVKPSPRGELEVIDAINSLADKKKVKIINLKNSWIHITSNEDLEKAKETLKNIIN